MKKILMIVLLAVSLQASAQFKWNTVLIAPSQTALLSMPTSGIEDCQLAVCSDTKLYFKFDAATSTWVPTETVKAVRSQAVVNLKATGSTLIHTTGDVGSILFYPTQYLLKVSEAPSLITIQPTISIGTNAPNYDNIVSGAPLATLLSQLGINSGSPSTVSVSYPIPANTAVYLRVITPATCVGNYRVKATLLGITE